MAEKLADALWAALDTGPRKRPALFSSGGPVSAGTLITEAEQLTGLLSTRGARVLAVLADNGPAWVGADLACLRAGVVHLPLPDFFTDAQLGHALDSAGADHLLTDRPARGAALAPGFAPVGSWGGLSLLARPIGPVALPAGTAKISFTSGSTGQPKGVCLAGDGLLATARALDAALAALPIDRHLAVLPLALLLENVAGVHAPLLRGAPVVLPGLSELGWHGMRGFDPAALELAVSTNRPASLILVPELLKAWTWSLTTRGRRAPDSPRFVAVGGARCDPALLAAAEAVGIPAFEGYGLTECGSVITLNAPGANRPGSVGRPLGHVVVAGDERGEIHARASTFLGYLGGPPAGDAGFATGDLGEFDADGFLHLRGRRDNLLVTGYGRNVSPEWVEAALLAEPAIRQAVVVGAGRPWLAGLLVPAPGVDGRGLAASVERVNAGLPDYARLRGWLAVPPFTPADGLATGNGRPRRAAILARHAAGIDALYASTHASTGVSA